MKYMAIIGIVIGAAVVYGVLHDQITVRICLEYFTVGHPPLFGLREPTLLALGWGVVATWWVGAALGWVIAFAARYGTWPKLEPHEILRPLGMLFATVACFALISGLIGYIAAVNHWVNLNPFLADLIPPEKHVAFLVDLWSHCASYVGGFFGGIGLAGYIAFQRRRRHQASINPARG